MEIFTLVFTYIGFYLLIGFSYFLITAVFSGFIGSELTLKDYINDFILWPISIATLIGLLIRIYKIKYDEYKIKEKPKPKLSRKGK